MSLVKNNIFSSRRERLYRVAKNSNTDCYVFFKHENIFYFTGFYGKDSNSILIISKGKAYLLVNFIYYEDAKACAGDGIEVILYYKNRMRDTASIITSSRFNGIAIGEETVAYTEFISLQKELERSGNSLSIGKVLLEKLRIVKDAKELGNIESACHITEQTFKKILDSGSVELSGFTELSLSNWIEKLCIDNGGNGRSFEYVVASGKVSSKPHHIPTHKNVEKDLLLLDFGTVYDHYCSDLTRTIFLNKHYDNKKIREIYHIVLEAQQKALEACREGIRCDELDSIARKYIEKAGYGEQFGHGLGHGVGLEVHEGPYITRKSKALLKENMVITIEPGIYLPGLGGVRIEDMVVVKKNGCRNLYSAKKDFTFLP